MSCSRPAENLVELPSASSDTINAERSGWRKPVQTQIVIRNAEQSNGVRASPKGVRGSARSGSA